MAAKTNTKSKTDEDVAEEVQGGELVAGVGTVGTGVEAFDDDFFGDETGLEGVDQADVVLPRFTVLQGLSPQVNPRKDEYVEGAQIGMIMNTATGRVYEEIPLIMAAYERRNIEWIPRDKPCPLKDFPQVTGGGLYKDYGTDDTILEECTRNEKNGSLWTPRGHEMVVTGTWYVIDPETLSRAFIAMGKTQFTPSKKLMAGITDEKVQTKSGIRQAPLFYRSWKMGTRMRQDGENEWFVFNHKPGPRVQEYVHGRDILEEVRRFREEIQEGNAIIDVTVGEVDANQQSGEDAAM